MSRLPGVHGNVRSDRLRFKVREARFAAVCPSGLSAESRTRDFDFNQKKRKETPTGCFFPFDKYSLFNGRKRRRFNAAQGLGMLLRGGSSRGGGPPKKVQRATRGPGRKSSPRFSMDKAPAESSVSRGANLSAPPWGNAARSVMSAP